MVMSHRKKYLSISFTELGRSRLAVVLSIVNWACILTSIGLLALGAYIKLDIEQYTNLLKDYDGNALPYILIAAGLASIIVNSLGGIACFLVADPTKREENKFLMVGYLVSSIVIAIYVFCSGMFCYGHIAHVKESFQGGLMEAVRAYRTDAHMKEEVDKLQMTFKCCGSRGHHDWFKIMWIPEEFQEMHQTSNETEYKHDDVPFSCCSPTAMRPCIHQRVNDNSYHHNYDYRHDMTIHTRGCRSVLMDYFGGELLINAGSFVVAVFVLQVIVIILARYLQTSIFEALAQEDPEAPSDGYFLDNGKKHSKPVEEDEEGSEQNDQTDAEDDQDLKPLIPQLSFDADHQPRRSSNSRRPSMVPEGMYQPTYSTISHNYMNSDRRSSGARKFSIPPAPPLPDDLLH